MTDLLLEQAPLVERDLELSALSRVAADVDAGARAVVVSGEAGIGKSRLCREFWTTLPPGWCRVEVAGYQAEPLPPFHPLLDSPAATSTPSELGDALRSVIDARRGGDRMLLVLEDIQWMDVRTADALAAALRRIDDRPVLVLVTFRTGASPPGSAVGQAVASLIREPSVSELRLGALSPAGVATLSLALGGRDSDADALYERTGGIPFFVEEVAQAPDAEVPWTVTEAIAARVAALPPEASDLARLLAVAGRPLSTAVLSSCVPGWENAAAVLAHAGLAVRRDGTPRLRHALIGEALERPLSEDVRRSIHGRLAAALAVAEPAAHEQIARHWLAAGEHELAARLRIVPPDAGNAAPADDSGGSSGGTGTTYELLAIAAAASDDLGQAITWAEAADRAYRAVGDHRRASAIWSSDALRGVVALRQSLWSAGSFMELEARSRDALLAGRTEEALVLADRMRIQIGPHTPADPRRRCAVALLEAGDTAAAEQVLAGCDQWARERGLSDELAMNNTRRAWVAFGQGHVGEALALLNTAAVDAHRSGEGVFQVFFDPIHAFVLAASGEVAEARRLAEALAAREGVGMFAALPMALVVHEDGDAEEAARLLGSVMPYVEALSQGDVSAEFTAVVAMQAVIELALGRPAEALAIASRCLSIDRSSISVARSDLLLTVAKAALALGDRPRAAEAVDLLRDQARAISGPGVQAAATLGEALLDMAEGRLAEAQARLEAAARAYEMTPRWSNAADAWCDAAEAAAGAARDAGPALAAADRICTTKGLARVGRRVRELRARQGAVRRPERGVLDRLTGRELDVVRLVGEGLTNRQIGERLYLSEGTVRNYLSRAFDRLGVSRRAEVIRLLSKLDG